MLPAKDNRAETVCVCVGGGGGGKECSALSLSDDAYCVVCCWSWLMCMSALVARSSCCHDVSVQHCTRPSPTAFYSVSLTHSLSVVSLCLFLLQAAMVRRQSVHQSFNYRCQAVTVQQAVDLLSHNSWCHDDIPHALTRCADVWQLSISTMFSVFRDPSLHFV